MNRCSFMESLNSLSADMVFSTQGLCLVVDLLLLLLLYSEEEDEEFFALEGDEATLDWLRLKEGGGGEGGELLLLLWFLLL